MKDFIIELLTDTGLFVVSGSMLGLYFLGGWTEPNRLILTSELLFLLLFIFLGLWREWRYFRDLRRWMIHGDQASNGYGGKYGRARKRSQGTPQ